MTLPQSIKTIDLNADLGEDPDSVEQDAALLRLVTSANIACGGHAGDERTMRRTLELAKRFGVAAGAHPSFPDRENFGRFEMNMNAVDLERSLTEQIAALISIAKDVGVRIVHVKPHGALYHAANNNPVVARSIGEVIRSMDASMIVFGQAASPVLSIYRELGLRTAAEAFADRAYEPDGSLRNRKLPGALHEDPQAVAQQALDIALKGCVMASDGTTLALTAETLCLHSDTPNSVLIAREVRNSLTQAGIHLQSLK